MARKEARVNLRVDADTYEPYARLAGLLTELGVPMSTAQLIRMVLESGVEHIELLASYAEAAKRGDKEAARSVFGAIVEWNQAHVTLMREKGEAENRAASRE